METKTFLEALQTAVDDYSPDPFFAVNLLNNLVYATKVVVKDARRNYNEYPETVEALNKALDDLDKFE